VGQLEKEWRTTIAEREIALMKDPATREEARQIEASGAGKGLMDALRAAHADFETAESGLLTVRSATKDAATATANLAIIFGTVAILIIASALAYMLTRHIGGAVASLTGVMGALASGKNDVEVPYQGRGDEIGEMAQSVLVFRDAALDKERMEREASENRNLSEKERAEREAAKAAEAQSLSSAIESLANGLQQLSDGNLTVRLDTPFAGDLDRLRTDFNSSVEKLAETLSDVKVNINTIHSQCRRDAFGRGRPVAPHRTAGRVARGNLRRSRRDHLDGEEFRRTCAGRQKEGFRGKCRRVKLRRRSFRMPSAP
jgi:methyl-accepting chemotaxis protein